jgi:hypothetical protein
MLRRPFALCCLIAAFCCAPLCLSAQSAAPTQAGNPGTGKPAQIAKAPGLQKPLLPPAFAGEPREGDIVVDPAPSTADAAHAAVLKEDGMVEASRGHYGSGASSGWTVQAIRFGDVTGAYSAFTFYRTPQMQPERVGEDAASGQGIFVVRSGATLVIARSDTHPPPNAASLLTTMRALVNELPRIYGPESISPIVPRLLPRSGLDARTIRYALGPAAYSGPLPVGILGFQADAEVASAQYRLHDGKQATLTLSMLPTPQLARELIRDVGAMPDATMHLASHQFGSLVGVVTGVGVSPADAAALLAQVHYAPQLTMAVPVAAGTSGPNQVALAASLLVSIAEFTILMAIAAVTLAAFFGFGRVYFRRLRGKPDSSLYDEEFITLKLK